MKRTAILSLSVAIVLAPVFASASHLAVVDPNDTRGRLDVRRVDQEGTAKRPRWAIGTYERWSPEDIFDTGWGVVHVDTFGDEHFDYYALIRSDGDKLIGMLYRNRSRGSDRFMRTVPADKSGARVMEVTIPLSQLSQRDNETYRWIARTMFTSGKCKNTCIDRAPNRGAITEGENTSTPAPVPTP